MEYNGTFGHNIGRIQNIDLMSRIGICYIACHMATKTMSPNLTGLQCIKHCIQYRDSDPNKTKFYPYIYYDGSNVIRLKWSGNNVED